MGFVPSAASGNVRLYPFHARRFRHYRRDLPRKLHCRIERQQFITAKELSRVHLVAVRLGFVFIAAEPEPRKHRPTLFGHARPHRDDAARFTIQPGFLAQLAESGLIERGTHESLLAQGGFYHHLYRSQFKGRAQPPALQAAR